jgi:error-prone DNA polymerase
MTEQYVELHAASAFSFLQASSQPESLVERAVELEMPAMALLDHNGIYGAARFHTTAQRNSIRAHIGAEVSVFSFGPRLTPPGWLPHQHKSEPARISLLCESREGYQNLCQLITQFKMREATKGDGAATCDDLSEYASGLICLTGGDEGPLAAALARGGEAAGRETVERLTRIYGRENVYVELQRHREREEEWRNQAVIRIARSLNLPVIATNGVRYATPYEREIQDLFTAIRNHVELDQAGRLLAVNSQRHIRTARELGALFRDVSGAIEITLCLYSLLGFKLSDLG